jgi:excisionase family DNA binding protein
MTLEAAIEKVVIAAIDKALAPYLRRLSDPEPLVYSVPEAAKVLSTSPNTIRRLIDQGILPTVPHMGQRVLVPRKAVGGLVNREEADAATGRPQDRTLRIAGE